MASEMWNRVFESFPPGGWTEDNKIFEEVKEEALIHVEPSSFIIPQFRGIRRATSMEELKKWHRRLSLPAANLAMNGPNFYTLSTMMSSIHDEIVNKVIGLTGADLPDERFVWVSMGRLGRNELVLATDQDNALIHSGGEFPKFAKEVVEGLNRLGMPKCTGNYMASNPKWNQALQVWRDYFRTWFKDPVPENVRYLTVFLDMRPVCGDRALYDQLAAYIRESITQEAIKRLALDAVWVEPPLGIFDRVTFGKGLDLKGYGIFPIVNGARVLAIHRGMVEITSTKERLESLRDMRIIGKEMCRDLLESYGFLQNLRLRHCSGSLPNDEKPVDLVRRKNLSKMDLLILKESFKVIWSFQKLLMTKYNVNGADSFSLF